MAQPKVFSINVSETTITALKFIGVIALINLFIAIVNAFAAGKRSGNNECGGHRKITLIPPSISNVDRDEEEEEDEEEKVDKQKEKKYWQKVVADENLGVKKKEEWLKPIVNVKDKPKRKYTKRKKD